ncbi:MAG: hypothetical protein WDM78_20155 [Puia sp.]
MARLLMLLVTRVVRWIRINHWVSYRRTNFTPGTYQIDVVYHDDDGYLFVNGVQVWSQTGCCTASPNVWTGTLGATDKV